MGSYCYRCGQHFLGPLTLRVFWDEVVSRISLERGFIRTIVELTTDPGGVIRRYLQGQRRRYVSPLTYLLTSAALSLLTFQLYDDAVAEWARATMTSLPTDDTPLLSPEQRIVYADALLAASQQATYVTLAISIPFALLLRALCRRVLTVVDAAVFSLFTLGHSTLIQAIVTPPLYLLATDLTSVSWISSMIYLVVIGVAAARFFESRWSIVKAMLAFIISFAVSSAIMSVVLLAYIVMFR